MRRFVPLVAIVAFAAMTIVGVAPVGHASAQEGTAAAESSGPLFSVSPVDTFPSGYVAYELEPGESQSFSARIGVGGTVDASLAAFVGDAVNPINGGFAVADIDDERTGATAWFTLGQETFELSPGDQQEIDVSVSVPEDATSGQYIVGLVVQTAEPLGQNEEQGSFGLLQIIRSAMAIVITVPGGVEAGFALGEPAMAVQNGIPLVSAPIENTGNVLVKPAGTLTIAALDGEEVVTAPIEMDSVYMGNATALQVILPGQFAAGDYLVSISLEDEASGETAEVRDVPVTMPAAEEAAPTFSFGVSVAANGEPIRYADVSAVIENNGPAIPTAKVNLHVSLDGEEVEVYPLADNQAISQGQTTISQRYIPADDWQTGTYTFAVEIIVVDADAGTETAIGTVESADEIVVD